MNQEQVLIVSIKSGETRYGRYSYGIVAIRPDGETFSLVNSGDSGTWEWLGKYSTTPLWARGAERLSPEDAGLSGDACHRLEDEGGYWRWQIALPGGWEVRGGSVSYLDRPSGLDAVIK